MIQERSTRRAPLVHIIINNWNGCDDTLACLASLYGIDYPRFVVLLVDNASHDGTPERVAAWARGAGVDVRRVAYRRGTDRDVFAATHADDARVERRLLIVENDANLGFTGANNVGFPIALAAGCDYALLLNNDTEVAPDFLSRMVAAAEREPAPTVYGAKILFHDPSDVLWFAGARISRWGTPESVGEGERDEPGRFTGIRDTQLVSGCTMLLPRAVLERVGGQDDRYFFAVDDTEYSCRIAAAGFRLRMQLDAVVYHKVSRAVRAKRPLQLYYVTRNTLLWRREHFGLAKNLLFAARFLPRWGAEVVARALYGQPQVSRGMLYGVLDFLRGRYGPCPYPWMNPSAAADRAPAAAGAAPAAA